MVLSTLAVSWRTQSQLTSAPLAATNLRNIPRSLYGPLGEAGPFASLRLSDSFAERQPRAFCFLFAKSLLAKSRPARRAKVANQVSRLPVGYRSIEYDRISDCRALTVRAVSRPR